jgi:methionyl-tRNA synthetase
LPDDTFYVTTPIYYVNDVPHIGHSYTTIAADVLARYHRLCGRSVHFLTGTDEHGIKIERAAEANGETPIELADRVMQGFQALWERLDIANDDFIRTTQPRHESVVQRLFEQLHERGAIYLGDYEGWYCVSCENFLAEDDLAEGNCPDCSKKVEWQSEKTYFFKMSDYGDRLLAFLDEHPEFIRPKARFNEIYSRVNDGLRDVSVSRSSLNWGVPVPFDDTHVIYVWLDALINYVSAMGYPDGDLFAKYWPADVHLIGKDIIWFHCVIWPCVLMALDLPLPRKVYAHGWWTNSGVRMAKSRGNFVDPIPVTEKYGVDPYRYFLLREMPFGQDGDFSETALIGRINNDLGNDLGNLLHRTLTMIEKYFDGTVPEPGEPDDAAAALRNLAAEVVAEVDAQIGDVQFSRALEAVWRLISGANRYIEEQKPWALAKDESQRAHLGTVMYSLAEALRITSLLLYPFMPSKMAGLRTQLALGDVQPPLADGAAWGGTQAGTTVAKGEPLFPKVEE